MNYTNCMNEYYTANFHLHLLNHLIQLIIQIRLYPSRNLNANRCHSFDVC